MNSASTVLPLLQDYASRYAWTPWGKVSARCAQPGNQAAHLDAVPLLQGLPYLS